MKYIKAYLDNSFGKFFWLAYLCGILVNEIDTTYPYVGYVWVDRAIWWSLFAFVMYVCWYCAGVGIVHNKVVKIVKEESVEDLKTVLD